MRGWHGCLGRIGGGKREFSGQLRRFREIHMFFVNRACRECMQMQ